MELVFAIGLVALSIAAIVGTASTVWLAISRSNEREKFRFKLKEVCGLQQTPSGRYRVIGVYEKKNLKQIMVLALKPLDSDEDAVYWLWLNRRMVITVKRDNQGNMRLSPIT